MEGAHCWYFHPVLRSKFPRCLWILGIVFLVKIFSLVNWMLCSDALCFSSPLCIIVDVANIRVNGTQGALNETSKHLFYITKDRRPSPLSAGGPRCANNLCLNGSDTTMHLHQDIWKKNGKHWAHPQWVRCIIELHKALLEKIASGEWILRCSRPLPHGAVKHCKWDLSEWSCIVSIKYIRISKTLYEKMPSISHWLLIANYMLKLCFQHAKLNTIHE